MNSGAGQFFDAFFTALERRDIPYVVLHSYRDFPAQIDSDVDYAVRDADIPKAHAVLAETATQTGWRIVQTLQYDIASYYTVVVDPQHPGIFIKLDRCSHYTRNGCLFIRDKVLLASRKKFNSFYIPAFSSEFIYTLAKVFAKGKSIADYLATLRELSTAEPARSEQLFHDVFGAEQGNLSDWFDRPPELWNQLATPMHQRNRYRFPQRLLEWRRRLRRTFYPTGLRTVYLGEDDGEVSQVISRMEPLLEPCFRKQLSLRFHPPGKPSNALQILSCFLAQWSQQISIVLPAYRRSTSVTFTGGFDDLLLHPIRYGLKSSEVLVRLVRHFLPKPEFEFALNLENQKPHQISQVTSSELEHKHSVLRRLAASDPTVRIINGPDTESAVLTIWREIIGYLAARDAKRWQHLGVK